MKSEGSQLLFQSTQFEIKPHIKIIIPLAELFLNGFLHAFFPFIEEIAEYAGDENGFYIDLYYCYCFHFYVQILPTNHF
jgi:hypothetical protein